METSNLDILEKCSWHWIGCNFPFFISKKPRLDNGTVSYLKSNIFLKTLGGKTDGSCRIFSETLELDVLEPVGIDMEMIGTSLAFIFLAGAASYGLYKLWMVSDSI